MTALDKAVDSVKSGLKFFEATAAVANRLVAEALNMENGSPEQLYALGMAAYETREFKTAEELLSASFRGRPSAETAARLAMCTWRDNRLPEARRWIERAIQMSSDGSMPALVMGFEMSFRGILAGLQVAQGEQSAGEETAKQALAVRAGDWVALHVLGRVQMNQGDFDNATTTLQTALAAHPQEFFATEVHTDLELATTLKQANLAKVPLAVRTTRAMWPG